MKKRNRNVEKKLKPEDRLAGREVRCESAHGGPVG
jgi:hypothetical protein